VLTQELYLNQNPFFTPEWLAHLTNLAEIPGVATGDNAPAAADVLGPPIDFLGKIEYNNE
jgi:hypothetical protein